MQESQIHDGVEFVAYDETAESMQPSEGALNDPAATITAQGPSILRSRPRARGSVRRDQSRTVSGKRPSQRVTVIAAIRNQTRKTSARNTDIGQHRFQQGGLTRGGAVDVQSQRHAFAVGDQHHFRAFTPAGWANLIAPPFAEAKVASTKHSVNFRRLRRSSRRNSFRQIASQTPNCSYKAKRLQQVEGLGYDDGRSRQRAPVLSTHRIPSSAARSSAQGRPPFGPPRSFGNSGASCRHCRSVNIRSYRGMRPPLTEASITPAKWLGKMFLRL